MKYINKDDLLIYIQEQLLNSSITGPDGMPDDGILDKIEEFAIGLVKSYIGGRYNIAAIFGDTVIRNDVLVGIISHLVIYRAIRRNAARKVPDDYTTLYSDALRELGKVQAGSLHLDNLPLLTAEDGTVINLVYGNNTNEDFFI